MDGLMWQTLAGGVIALLLSILAFFLKLLIQDIRQVGKELSKLKESVIRLESDQFLIKSLLEKRIFLKTIK